MRKWLYCILLTAMVLPMVSCRRAVEKARRNIRLEAVEKVERKGMGGAEAVVRVKNGTGYKLVLERVTTVSVCSVQPPPTIIHTMPPPASATS